MLVKYEPWVINDKENALWGVKILEGEFVGTAIAFNDFDMKDASEQLVLDYTVFQAPEGKKAEDIEGPEFDKTLNLVVMDILEKALNDFEDRKRNSTESSE